MSRPRVLVVGLGDTGVLTAIHLARHDLEVVGVATKPGLVSGQELGLRLADPQRWSEDYWVDFARYRRLDPVRRLAGRAISLDPAARTVTVRTAAGQDLVEAYDALVISTGVSNGFWRRPDLQTREEVDADLLPRTGGWPARPGSRSSGEAPPRSAVPTSSPCAGRRAASTSTSRPIAD